MLGDVGGGVGDDTGDGDNDTGLGVDAGNTAYDILEGPISDADHASRTIVDLLVGDGIGLWQTHINEMNEVGHIIVGDCDGSIGSAECRLLADFRLVYELEGGVFYNGVDVIVASVNKQQVRLRWELLPYFFIANHNGAVLRGDKGAEALTLDVVTEFYSIGSGAAENVPAGHGERVDSTDYRVQSTDYRVQITEYRLQSTDYRVQITDYRVQITEYRVIRLGSSS